MALLQFVHKYSSSNQICTKQPAYLPLIKEQQAESVENVFLKAHEEETVSILDMPDRWMDRLLYRLHCYLSHGKP